LHLRNTSANTDDIGWLVSKGRDEEALDILRTHHCGGDESDELATFELREIQRTLSFEKEHSSGSWFDLVRTKGNRHRTWICVTCAIAAQASGTTLTGCKYPPLGYLRIQLTWVPDYLAVVLRGVGITNPRTQSIINGCLTMWNMGFAFWGAYVIDKFGRRPMMLSSLSGMLCALIGWTVASAIYTIHGTTAAGTAVIPLIFVFTASYSTVWNGILTGYTVEVMSYDIRSKLICTQNLLVQATITGFNYLNPVALENIEWKSVLSILW
jgi:hypothetical protein